MEAKGESLCTCVYTDKASADAFCGTQIYKRILGSGRLISGYAFTVAPQSLVWTEETEDVQEFGDGEFYGEDLAAEPVILDGGAEVESTEEGFGDITEFSDDAGEILDEDSLQSAENIEAMSGEVEAYAYVVDVKTPNNFGESFSGRYYYSYSYTDYRSVNMYSVQSGTYKLR